MRLFSFFKRKPKNHPTIEDEERPQIHIPDIRRQFYNEAQFQCYTTFFAHWGGWISAGHCLTEAGDLRPAFAQGSLTSWPDGLDAALIGTALPALEPLAPKSGQAVIAYGYPAGSRHLERRHGRVYFERAAGRWIAHITQPDEPVVTGMSGGPVIDQLTGDIIGIVITRNSPADLDHDRDPDESFDFIALSAVWNAVATAERLS